MSDINKTYRIKTNINGDITDGFVSIDTDLIQDYDTLDILSIKLKSIDMYRLHNSKYGVVVGRVLANNGFGIPNAKISIFIPSDNMDIEEINTLYPYQTSGDKDGNDVRYNLLPDEKVSDCHQIVGTFPNKRYLLDNNIILEVYDKYYKYTTRTNNSGDYLLMGVPVGVHTLHMDLDLSDCGILSQKPRDFIYKGYNVEQFETPTTFKSGTNYSELSQVFTQNQVITVQPFWGNESLGEPIGITRADINVAFKFEPTCVFIGCVVSDNNSNGITQKCSATENMGNMEELTTGSGTIEMIRKTPSGDIESFQVKGTELINGNGVWCYQIPMNLDYMMTDECGNMVPTDDPSKGIPTRTSVRFRISMQENEENLDNFFRSKVLVPHNPQMLDNGKMEGYDYEFGSLTKEESFRDLFWDNVYSVKSFIPRFQKSSVVGWKDKKFTGIKNCNFHGSNNPIPYNNLRIKLPFMFTVMCAIVKCLMFITAVFNTVINYIGKFLAVIGSIKIFGHRLFSQAWETALDMKLNVLSEGLCPDLENWYFAPIIGRKVLKHKQYNLLSQTLKYLNKGNGIYDEKAIDYTNSETEDEVVCLTTKTDYLISCIEMNLAMEYKVINFDFYNDWINGLIYIPRFMRYVKPRNKKVKGCMDNTKIFAKSRKYTQMCSLSYLPETVDGKIVFNTGYNPKGKTASYNLHKSRGFEKIKIFGKKGGICHEHTTSKKQHVYYMKPCEWSDGRKINLYATDIVLLGSLKPCDENGLPQAFKYLSSTSYVMPPNLALTNMETNGYLYVNDKNTICAGNSNQKISDDTNKDNGVTLASLDGGISDELAMYADSGAKNVNTNFDKDELIDIIPLTEIAGVSWNYTGPGQGEPNNKLLYNPGGHFLGLSCVNSQTNIKSCINLSRICEVGSTMSQRKEDISYEKDGETHYVYTVPTGFISGNDINGEDFRAMFATMNHNILKATKFTPETGYYFYDFNFIKPINFNGAFNKIVKEGNNVYNNSIKINQPNINYLKRFNLDINIDNYLDYDDNEFISTQTKTYEDTSIDYYLFRLGLDSTNLRNKRDKKHDSKFLKRDGRRKALPQYENSFYFYFGMKAGASAIDEFNKQFYSVCETSVLTQPDPIMDIKVEEINLCLGTGIVKIILDNIETPITYFTYKVDKGDGVEVVNVTNEENKNKYVHELELTFGKYTFEIMDTNGVYLSKDITVGLDLFTYLVDIHDFNVNNANNFISHQKNEFIGGSIEVSDLDIDFNYQDAINSNVTLSVECFDEKNIECSATTILGSNKSTTLYVKKANTRYNLYLTFKCSSENAVEHRIFLQTFEVKDGSSVELRMGFQEIPFYINIASLSGETKLILPSNTTNEDGENFTTENDESPYLLFGDNGKNWWDSVDPNGNDSVSKWLKRLSYKKTTSDGETFSNNIFTSKGEKILWGVPQNEEEKGGAIYNTEQSPTEYSGYSLDDDASYHATGDYHYSAIAIDEDVVSGDFFAILSGWNGSEVIINSEGCLGSYPVKNSGYVYKSIPDGNLYFYTYSGSSLEYPNSDLTSKGVFYSSFQYPVVEKPFKVEAKFFIWEGLDIIRNENSDAEAELEFQELAGRTEITINGGLRFDKKIGPPDGNGIYISNIDEKELSELTDDKITLSGMNVQYTIIEKGEPKVKRKNAFTTTKNNFKYSTGIKGVEDVSCEITEGYPIIKDSNFDFSQLVTTYSSHINYSNYFADYIVYTFKEGKGYSVIPKGENGLGSFYLSENEETYKNEDGFLCYQADERNGIIYLPEGNDKYIYLRTGGPKRPTYYILCKYINSANHDSKVGDLTILKVDYYTNRKFMIAWEYLKEESETTKTVKATQRVSKAGGMRDNLTKILSNRAFGNYMEPVKNYRLNASIDWCEEIKTKKLTSISNKKEDGVIFYVDKYAPNSYSNDNTSLYKIYPICIEQLDNSVLSMNCYSITTDYFGFVYKNEGMPFEFNGGYYNSGNTWQNIIQGIHSGMVYYNIMYELESGDTSNNLQTTGEENAKICRLEVKCGSVDFISLSGVSSGSTNPSFSANTDLFEFIFYGGPEIKKNDKEGSYEVKWLFSVEVKSGLENGVLATDEKNENITFRIKINDDESETETFKIRREKLKDYFPMVGYTSERTNNKTLIVKSGKVSESSLSGFSGGIYDDSYFIEIDNDFNGTYYAYSKKPEAKINSGFTFNLLTSGGTLLSATTVEDWTDDPILVVSGGGDYTYILTPFNIENENNPQSAFTVYELNNKSVGNRKGWSDVYKTNLFIYKPPTEGLMFNKNSVDIPYYYDSDDIDVSLLFSQKINDGAYENGDLKLEWEVKPYEINDTYEDAEGNKTCFIINIVGSASSSGDCSFNEESNNTSIHDAYINPVDREIYYCSGSSEDTLCIYEGGITPLWTLSFSGSADGQKITFKRIANGYDIDSYICNYIERGVDDDLSDIYVEENYYRNIEMYSTNTIKATYSGQGEYEASIKVERIPTCELLFDNDTQPNISPIILTLSGIIDSSYTINGSYPVIGGVKNGIILPVKNTDSAITINSERESSGHPQYLIELVNDVCQFTLIDGGRNSGSTEFPLSAITESPNKKWRIRYGGSEGDGVDIEFNLTTDATIDIYQERKEGGEELKISGLTKGNAKSATFNNTPIKIVLPGDGDGNSNIKPEATLTLKDGNVELGSYGLEKEPKENEKYDLIASDITSFITESGKVTITIEN